MQKKLLYLVSFIAIIFAYNQAEAACNWKNRTPYFYTWDSCNSNTKKASINAYVSFQYNTSCFKYTWKVNGNIVNGTYVMNKAINQNGTYTISLTVRDTCNNCDTTFTGTKTISCFPNCNWKAKNLSILGGDSCSQYPYKPSIRVFLYGSTSCAKYTWKVNGNFVSNGMVLNYKATQNGTYNLSVNVRDTCNNCDTTYSKSITITCASSCNWKSKNATFGIVDSCSFSKSKPNFLSYIYFQNTSTPCLKYTWKVNGTTVQNGTKTYISYFPSQNGTYNVTVNVRDTCSNCDTTYTSSVYISCASKCNWSNKNATFYIVDSCSYSPSKPNFLNYLYFQNNTSKCLKYTWKVNGTTIYIGSNPYKSYFPTQNGTYNVTVNVRDTCLNCDTTYSKSITINCASACNWKARNLSLYAKDSCNINNKTANITSIISISSNSCVKYLWKVNGVVKSNSYYFYYPIYTNGQYTVCLTLTDTCLKCDTSICFTKTISCLSSCNWKSRNPYTYAWDSCKGNNSKLNAYISFNYNRASCFKYLWKVNGKSAGYGNVMSYPITQNGTYSICVKALDTCNNCDTTMCFTKTINCFSACNWKSRITANNYFDSCNGVGYANSLNAYVAMNQNYNTSCYTYRWTVNGAYVGNKYYFHTPIYLNGAYNVCVKITDTCTKCDTTLCSRRVINCNNLGLKNNGINLVKIYPNPASSYINIESSQASEYAEILSVDGKAVWTGKLEEGSNNIVTDQWSRGIYIVRVKTVSGIGNYKIILE